MNGRGFRKNIYFRVQVGLLFLVLFEKISETKVVFGSKGKEALKKVWKLNVHVNGQREF